MNLKILIKLILFVLVHKLKIVGGINEPHSAYKSMRNVKNKKPSEIKNKGKLKVWMDEKWENLTAKITDGDKFYNCGTKGKKQKKAGLPSVCRPSKRINNKTPKPLANELSKKQIIDAVNIKKQGKRIKWKEL
jgi:hypothetical protein